MDLLAERERLSGASVANARWVVKDQNGNRPRRRQRIAAVSRIESLRREYRAEFWGTLGFKTWVHGRECVSRGERT